MVSWICSISYGDHLVKNFAEALTHL